MYPLTSSADDSEDDEFSSCKQNVSDQSHLTPSTFVPSTYHQEYTSGINCCHPTTYSRK